MKTTKVSTEETRLLIRNLIQKAKDSNLAQWNEGLNFAEFVHALWRLFLRHDSFKNSANKILNQVSENYAIEMLAEEINSVKS
ncbi:hypothetical protein [Abyssalbus ytuae]|uniref:Uncharacterized protein n=1 Tax=Abyssalbus ytuae TaxID=2926907 RepID=A0A9E7CZN5_9FLAO|nr:hypothetical protein [Abyssalbus ytuae]UOB17710.1 hypothetical protein MQE35_00080 [Abyssalbus ytuae]